MNWFLVAILVGLGLAVVGAIGSAIEHRRERRAQGRPTYSIWRHLVMSVEAEEQRKTSASARSTPSPSVAYRSDDQAKAAARAARADSTEMRRRAAIARRMDMSGSIPAGGDTVEFLYMDRDGNTSRRTVDVDGVTPQYITGWDHDRLATRTFRWDRISGHVLVADTGEMLHPDECYKKLSVL